MGSSQSAGRAMAGMFAPRRQPPSSSACGPSRSALASIIGPLTYGAITWVTGGNQRIAILSTAVLFVVGLVLLAQGRRAARPRAAAQADDEPLKKTGAWRLPDAAAAQAAATGMLLNSPVAMRFCHSAGPVMCALVPPASTATVTGMSTTSNS